MPDRGSTATTVPDPWHGYGIDQAGLRRRFFVRTTAWTHSPGVAVGVDSHRSTRMPCSVVDASGRPFGWYAGGNGTSHGGVRRGHGNGSSVGAGDGTSEPPTGNTGVGGGDPGCARAPGVVVATIATRRASVNAVRRLRGVDIVAPRPALVVMCLDIEHGNLISVDPDDVPEL
jgi:hypothetical protein